MKNNTSPECSEKLKEEFNNRHTEMIDFLIKLYGNQEGINIKYKIKEVETEEME